MSHTSPLNPKLDLSFERIIDVPPHWVWRAWTEPELLKQWFCPLPWKTVAAQIDLRAGGQFSTTMQSPEGQSFHNSGCYLQIVKNQTLTWTNALLPGFRPAPVNAPCGDDSAEFMFTASINMLAHESHGTRYRATVYHADEKGCQQHAAMGFEAGWGAALDQLVAMVKKGI